MLLAAPFLMQANPSIDSAATDPPSPKELIVKKESTVKDTAKHRMFSFAAKPIKNRFTKMSLRSKKAKSLIADSLFAKNDSIAPKHEKLFKGKRAKKHQHDSLINTTAHVKDSIRRERPSDSVAFEGFKHEKDSIADAKPAKIEVKVFPNPVADVLSIATEATVLKVKVICGTRRTAVIEAADTTEVDLTPLEAGLYMIEVITDGGSESVTVLKQ